MAHPPHGKQLNTVPTRMEFKFIHTFFSISLDTATSLKGREPFPCQLRAGHFWVEDFAVPHVPGGSRAIPGAKGCGAERPSFVLREYCVCD